MHASVQGSVRLQRVLRQVQSSWGWARLDREIAAGAPVEALPARHLRAEQLLCPEERRAIAAALSNILDGAEALSRSGRARERREAAITLDSRGALLRVIALLRSDVPMTPGAVARAELLACVRRSALLSPRSAGALAEQLGEITGADPA